MLLRLRAKDGRTGGLASTPTADTAKAKKEASICVNMCLILVSFQGNLLLLDIFVFCVCFLFAGDISKWREGIVGRMACAMYKAAEYLFSAEHCNYACNGAGS